MCKRFGESELYDVRNKVPIRHVIESVLNIPNKVTEGKYRFLCPRCGNFDTALNEQNNLSRCFGCEKNFNCVDLLIEYKKITFVDSVKLLQQEITKSEKVKLVVHNFIKQQSEMRFVR